MPPKFSTRCGGHITLLFTVDKSSRLKRSQGSRGAGFAVQHGVRITGTLRVVDEIRPLQTMVGIDPDRKPANYEIPEHRVSIIDMNGQQREDITLYLDFLQACRDAKLLRDHEWLELDVILECPTSQGFGMSAAGLMALGTVVKGLSERGTTEQYEKIAHRIEREHGAGLGDVLGLSVGGIELRLEPGAPGWPGQAVSFAAESPVLLVWDASGERHTSTYIDDPVWQSSITQAGNHSMNRLREETWGAHRWRDLLQEARAFSEASGMLSEDLRARVYRLVLAAVQDLGFQAQIAARLCMLGSSVAIVPRTLEQPPSVNDLEALQEELHAQGLQTLLTAFSEVKHRREVGSNR